MRLLATLVLLGGCVAATKETPVAPVSKVPLPTPTAVLESVHRLPAFTFTPDGPVSGARVPGGPWRSQPLQGFSGLVAEPHVDGGVVLLAVSDNGYGAAENSDDFVLRVVELHERDDGTLTAATRFVLSDPDRRLPFPVVNALASPSTRVLTGADLDPESFVRAPDGTFWFGDEFGPFLVHTDAQGRVLEAPFSVPGLDGGVLRGPDAPVAPANLALRSLQALRAHTGTRVVSPDATWLTSAEQVRQWQRAGFAVIPWTVNDPERIRELLAWHVDGLISDRPDLVLAAVPDGGTFDVQGHRGARGLRPENTLPAFEAALELGVTTLELDLTATRDGAVVWHDPTLSAPKCREALALAQTTSAQLHRARCDGVNPSQYPDQRVGPVGPVTLDFVKRGVVSNPYAPLALKTLLDFVARFETLHPERKRVRLNVETKINAPQDVVSLTRHVGQTVAALGPDWQERVTLQSFDWASLELAAREFPWLATVALIEPSAPDEARRRHLGLPWPVQTETAGPDVRRSGGFENLAMSPDGNTLYAMLEKPLAGSAARELLAFAFDLGHHEFHEGVAFRFALHPRATAVGDFTLISPSTGYALERDDSDGALDGYKHLIQFTLSPTAGQAARRTGDVDLLRLPQTDGGTFAFPYFCIEGVTSLGPGHLAVVNDNNFPFGRGRHPDSGVPDDTELIHLRTVDDDPIKFTPPP